MPYFTSWDANVFLCLLYIFPEEVVREMIKIVKEKHEKYVKQETLNYWLSLEPSKSIENDGLEKLYCSTHYTFVRELKKLWLWRCPEKRRTNIVQWSRSDHDWNCQHVWSKKPFTNPGKGLSRKGYWNSGEAWWYSINDCNIDTSDWESYEEEIYFDMKEKSRRSYVAQWYGNIHEGRFFLFFKENDIFEQKLFNDFRYSQTTVKSICDIGRRAQVSQDFLTLDGGGLGEKPGKTIEHIDDIFKKI